MKLAPSGVGAEPKKLVLLAGILVLGAAVYWFQNRSSAPEQTVSASVNPPQAIQPVKPLPEKIAPVPHPSEPGIPVPPRASSRVGNTSSMEDFRPSMKVKDDLDVSQIDPRIRLDLLVKLRALPMEGGSSSLFEFGKPPEPPAPPVPPIVPAPPKPVPPPVDPAKAKADAAAKAGPPPAPPIPFQYYGYAGKDADGQLEGLFRDGDPNTGDIYYKREGETIKDRYKIVRIGIRSAVVEDTMAHTQQTLPLLEEQQ